MGIYGGSDYSECEAISKDMGKQNQLKFGESENILPYLARERGAALPLEPPRFYTNQV